MKKVILFFGLLLGCSIFANANPEVNKIEEIEEYTISLNGDEDLFGCRASCWGEVTNTETGESAFFTASVTADDCVTAQTSCINSVMRKIHNFMHAN
ncbi:hypothetical protein CLV33_103111 [Jejuia pallidilutea]|uniref:Uncharacterized protein n=1 Tax=Jejuia pallidilutea TaxID=504487 RepID=A0A362X192_9FLAO|nr:hypothetical protein [Jejuia pallidilutea]PQV49480.1 hypothetical protein CLV33_103111 [Jejuia pallidilutea]